MADFVTFYVLVAGERPMSREELDRLVRPLVGSFVTLPMRTAIQAVAIPTPVVRRTSERDPDTGETFTTEILTPPSGPFAGDVMAQGIPTITSEDRSRFARSRFITGVKWHMRLARSATDADIVSSRGRIRDQVYPALRSLGLSPYFFTMQRARRPLPSDRGIPPTPPIPGVLDTVIAVAIGVAAAGVGVGLENWKS